MRLKQKEKDIYFLAQLQAQTPLTQIEELKSYSQHIVRYYLRRGLENQTILPRCFTSLNRLGLNQYEVYFALSSEKPEARRMLVQALCASERVSWLGQVGGGFQYGVNLAARGVREIAALFYELSSKYGVLFVEKVIAERLWFKYYGNKYLSGKKRRVNCLSYGLSAEAAEIDEVDHRILSSLTRSGVRSSRLLGRELGLPQTTVDFRLRRLEQSGIVAGYYYEVQSAALGMQNYILLVCLKSLSPDFVQRFEKFCAAHPNVVILVHSLGSWDFEAGIEAQSAREAAAIIEQFCDFLGSQLNWVRALPAFANLKVAEYPFISFAAFKS